MIKLKKIAALLGETTLVFDVDFPDGSIAEVSIPAREITERMLELKRLLRRRTTSDDLRDIIVAIISQIREGKEPVERFDFNAFMGVDLEQ